jgi:cytochrome P450
MEEMKIPSVTGFKAFKKVRLMQRDAIEFFMSLFREHGDMVHFSLTGENFYALQDPILIRYVLQENNSNYTKSIFYKELAKLVGNGLLTSEGAEWKKNRRIAQPAFKKSAVESFSKLFFEETDAVVKEWKEKKQVDISKEMMRITFRIVGKALFGANVDAEAKIIDQSLEIAMIGLMDRMQSIIKIPYFLPTPQNIRLKKAIKQIDTVVHKIISQRIQSGERVPDFLDNLIHARDEESGQGLNEKQIRDEVVTFLLAGHETTSNALTWCFYLLSEHPEIKKTVIDEIRKNIPSNGEIPFEVLDKLIYTSRVLQESMRLYPPAWVIERSAINDDNIGGHKIKAKSMISVCVYAIHRNPKYWENPETFDPERFLPENEAKRHNFAYLPFGGGPRVCIGQNFAFTEAIMILATVFREFNPTLSKDQIVEKEALITLRPKFGMKMNLL